MFKINKIAFTLMALSLLIFSAPAAAQSSQPIQHVICVLGTEVVDYHPGLTNVRTTRHVSVQGTYDGCVPIDPGSKLSKGTTSFEFDYVGSCSNPLDTNLQDRRTIAWNTGETSTLSGKVILNEVVGALLSVTILGQVESGLFEGAAYQLQITAPLLRISDPLACQRPQGVTRTTARAVLIITGT